MMMVLLHEGHYEEALKLARRLSSDPVWPARIVRAYLEKRPPAEVRGSLTSSSSTRCV